MTISTSAVIVVRSGTSWTVDVTAANLSTNLLVKDFLVINQTTDTILSNSNFTKTSATVLSYSGADIGTDQSIEVRRDSPISRFQEQQFGNKFDSATYNEEIDRILGVLFEFDLFGTGEGNIFVPSPLNQAYGVSWSTDTIRGRTANVLYTELETCTRVDENENISGDWAFNAEVSFAPTNPNTTIGFGTNADFAVNGGFDVNSPSADFLGSTQVLVPTVAATDSTNKAANTATVRDIIDSLFVGSLAQFTAAPPSGWLFCDGTTFSAATYPALNTHLGGNTLPDLRDKFLLSSGPLYPVNTTGGSANAVVVTHNHGVTDGQHNHGVTDGGHAHGSGIFRDVGLGNGSFVLSSGAGTNHTTANTDVATSNITTNVANANITVNNAGVSGTGANLPPYTSLNIYIFAGEPQT